MPDFDTSVPHIARVYDYWLVAKTTLVKWFRDSRTEAVLWPYRHFMMIFRKSYPTLYAACSVHIWGLCPVFERRFPDSSLTPLTGFCCLAWGFAGSGLALTRAGLARQGGWKNGALPASRSHDSADQVAYGARPCGAGLPRLSSARAACRAHPRRVPRNSPPQVGDALRLASAVGVPQDSVIVSPSAGSEKAQRYQQFVPRALQRGAAAPLGDWSAHRSSSEGESEQTLV
jgi:hypothetical protein